MASKSRGMCGWEGEKGLFAGHVNYRKLQNSRIIDKNRRGTAARKGRGRGCCVKNGENMVFRTVKLFLGAFFFSVMQRLFCANRKEWILRCVELTRPFFPSCILRFYWPYFEVERIGADKEKGRECLGLDLEQVFDGKPAIMFKLLLLDVFRFLIFWLMVLI